MCQAGTKNKSEIFNISYASVFFSPGFQFNSNSVAAQSVTAEAYRTIAHFRIYESHTTCNLFVQFKSMSIRIR